MKKIFPFLLFLFYASVLPSFSIAQCRTSFAVLDNPATCTPSSTRNFYDSSLLLNIGDNIIKEIWNYGDGLSDTITSNFSTNITHTFIKDGTIGVSLTIFTASGCTTTYTKSITLWIKPKADFIYTQDSICTSPAFAYFNSTSQILTPNLTPYIWEIDDAITLYGDTTSYSFTKPGLHIVMLIARSRYGACRDTMIKTIAVAGKPKTNFSYEPINVGSKTIEFKDATTQSYIPLSGYYWDFGDGTTSTEANPTHTYTTFDSFLVTHYAINSYGCNSDTLISKVYVDPASFTPGGYQSNAGNEFWTGFGYQEKMSRVSGSTNEAKLSLYIAAGHNPTRVTITLPGIGGGVGFPKIITIPADSIVEVTGFPTGDPYNNLNPNGLPDARLFYTGTSNRGIHILSNNPVSVWEEIYCEGNSAGMSLLVPVNVWGNDYFVQSMGGKSNNPNPNSFFFVMAKEDNTTIEFTPAKDIIDSSLATIFTDGHTAANIKYYAGVTYQLLLNKGQVFNAMGFISGSGSNTAQAVDLSGTHITSTDPFKKIAVFGGNGRVLINTKGCINTSGSDNLIQQMFPKTVWGTKYLTTPTKLMEYGIYRITVSDTSSLVKVNGSNLAKSTLINNSYYQVEGNQPNLIESDKRVMVTQYIISPGTCPGGYLVGNSGDGDPEMINLSSTKYPINEVKVYAPLFKTGLTGASFINVIIKKEGIASFRLDNSTTADSGKSSFVPGPQYGNSGLIPIENIFKIHPGDTNYAFARFKISPNVTHTLKSDSAFLAIVYGIAGGESYGFNAGFNFYAPHLVYHFTGVGNWTDVSNWENNTMPPDILPNGSEVRVSGNAFLNVPQIIEDGAVLIVETGGKLTINGNLLIQK